MDTECPGRRNVRKLDSMLVRCPKCNQAVEIFTDEIKARCRCGEVLLRESVPACISWCASAEKCLGEVVDLRLIREKIQKSCAPGSAGEYVKEIGKKVKESQHGDNSAGPEVEKKVDLKP
jgi:hypothetical protein